MNPAAPVTTHFIRDVSFTLAAERPSCLRFPFGSLQGRAVAAHERGWMGKGTRLAERGDYINIASRSEAAT